MKVNQIKQAYVQTINEIQRVVPEKNKVVEKMKSEDKITLNKSIKNIKKYVEQVKACEGDMGDKVSRIKQQIADGTYEISVDQIANAIFSEIEI